MILHCLVKGAVDLPYKSRVGRQVGVRRENIHIIREIVIDKYKGRAKEQ